MTKEEFEKFSASQSALRDYMDFRDTNAFMHEARVLFSTYANPVCSKIFKVIPMIDTNYSFVEIIGDEEFARDLKPRYTNLDSEFIFINGTLQIISKDVWGKSIEIDVSAI